MLLKLFEEVPPFQFSLFPSVSNMLFSDILTYEQQRVYNFLTEHMGQMDAQDEYGRNCIFHAIMYGTPQNLQDCLERGANPNTIDACGNTPISWLLTHFLGCQEYMDRYDATIKLDILLQYGADANIHALQNLSPLTIAALSNNPIIVGHLLNYGVSIKDRSVTDSELGLIHKNASALSLAASISATNIIPLLKSVSEPELIFHALQKADSQEVRDMLLAQPVSYPLFLTQIEQTKIA